MTDPIDDVHVNDPAEVLPTLADLDPLPVVRTWPATTPVSEVIREIAADAMPDGLPALPTSVYTVPDWYGMSAEADAVVDWSPAEMERR